MSSEINLKGYLEKSYLDKDGAKHITFECSVKDAVEQVKLELLARDITNHLPVLLDIKVTQSKEDGRWQEPGDLRQL